MNKRQYNIIIQPSRWRKKCCEAILLCQVYFATFAFGSFSMDGKYKNLPWALAKELSQAQCRPSWESQNEGIHERISFDDTIWGFNLAGGAFYDTPLRVTQVKENSRAYKAGIKVGDILRYINDVDTSLLTVQEAHDMILQSGIEIKLKLSAPDVDEPYHYTYEDEILEELRQMKRKRDEEIKKKRKPFTGAKTNSEWSCAWPCNKKRDVMYRESNCFLIPSKHEEKIRLIKEKQKRVEERAVEQKNKEIIKSMMQAQNAYHMMDSDEEIEPQYFELLHKNVGKTKHLENNTSKEESSNIIITAEALENNTNNTIQENMEELRNEDRDRDNDNFMLSEDYEGLQDDLIGIDNEDSNQNKHGIILLDDEVASNEKTNEEIQKIKSDSENEDSYSNQDIDLTDESKQNDKDEKATENEYETDLDDEINENAFDERNDEDIHENESDTTDKEKNDSKLKANRSILNGNGETQSVDEEFSIPSDDEEMFHEELVILDESEIYSDNMITDEDNEDPIINHLKKK